MAETSISGIEFKIVGTTERAKTAVDKLTSSLKGLKTALSSARTAKLEKELEGIDKNAKKSTTTLGKLFKSVGRIGFYRAIRSALRFITEGFREGLQNAYQFSKMVGYDLAGTMDNLATKSLTMKNQLGSALGGLIQTLEPILIQIISLITKAANAFAQLFAIIGGRKTYLKAVDTMTQYGEAVGGVGQAAKEAMRYLAPFDELNVLPADNGSSGGGGGASTPDYSQMFEVTEVDSDSILGSLADMFNNMADWFEEQDWKSLGSSVWKGLKEAFSDDGKADDVVRALFRTLGAVSGAVVGFTWGFISEAVESIMTSFKNSIRDYNGDGKIGITDVLTGIWNFAITPLVWIDENIVKPFWRGFTGALFGEEQEPITVSEFFSWAFKALTDNAITGWIKNNIITPIKNAFSSPFSNDDDNPGKSLGDSILDGIAKPFKDIGNWIKEHIIDPIKEKISNFSLTELLFGGGDDSGTPAAGSAESFGYEIEVTGIKDSIPLKDKIINGVKALLDSTDQKDLPADQKKLDGFGARLKYTIKGALPAAEKKLDGFWARITNTIKGALPADERKLDDFWARIKHTIKGGIPTEDRKLDDFWARVKHTIQGGLPESEKKLDGFWARLTNTIKGNLTDEQKTINTTSNYTKSKDSLTETQKTFGSKANFNTWQNSLSNVWSYAKSWFNTWENDNISPWSYAKSWFNTWDNSYGEEPWANAKSWFKWYEFDVEDQWGIWAYAKAYFNSYDTSDLGTPTIDVTAHVVGSGGNYTMASGGAYYGNRWHGIPQAASGGKFHGTLFWAGEAGPEVVGKAGGRTEVLNRSQLASTMYAAVTRAMSGVSFQISGMKTPTTAQAESYDEEMIYRAMLRALNDSDVFPDEIDLDGDVVYRKMVQRNRSEKRRLGVNPMMAS